MHLPNRPFSYRETPEHLSSLRQLLVNIALPHWRPPTTTQRNILNLACGRSDETGVLADLFTNPGDDIRFTGIDIRSAELDEATARWSHKQSGPSQLQTEFITCDGAHLNLLREIPSPPHLAFFRHQNFWNGPRLWTSLYDQALERLSPQGIVIITSYFDKEHLLALKAFETLGAHLLATAQNPNSHPIPATPGKSADRHLAVFSRNKPEKIASLLVR